MIVTPKTSMRARVQTIMQTAIRSRDKQQTAEPGDDNSLVKCILKTCKFHLNICLKALTVSLVLNLLAGVTFKWPL